MGDDFGGRVRLGGFELDLHSGELCPIDAKDNQQKVLLREQPFRVLRMLIAGEGKIVTGEAIKKQLWPNDTIVDFDHSINVAIRVLRQALGDFAGNPKHIETLARRGFRLEVARPSGAGGKRCGWTAGAIPNGEGSRDQRRHCRSA